RVCLRAHAGAEEQISDVLQAYGRLVDQVLTVAAAMEAACDRNLCVVLVFERDVDGVVVRKGERHFGIVGRWPRIGAVEDHVLHAAAAEMLGALLAHAPSDGIDDVRFTAAVRPDDAHDFVIEVDDRPVDERLEPAELEALDLHLKRILPCRRDRSGFVPNFIPAAYLAIVSSASCVCSAFPQLSQGGSRAVAIGRTSCHFTYGHCSVVTPERVDMQAVKMRSANFHVKTRTWAL